jgi:hypothetical protein
MGATLLFQVRFYYACFFFKDDQFLVYYQTFTCKPSRLFYVMKIVSHWSEIRFICTEENINKIVAILKYVFLIGCKFLYLPNNFNLKIISFRLSYPHICYTQVKVDFCHV